MPADGGRIKQDFGAPEGGQARRFGIPLIPAHADANVSALRFPALKTEISRCEIKFFIVTGIVGNMHFAILPENFASRVDDHGGVVINTSGAFFKERSNDHDRFFPRNAA